MEKINVGILSLPMTQANVEPFFNLVNVIRGFSSKSYVIATYGKNAKIKCLKDKNIYHIIHKPGNNLISIVFRYILTQFRISWRILKLSKNVNFWVFYISDSSIMPMITAKIIKKKVVLALGGHIEKETELRENYIYRNLSRLLNILKKINLELSDCIVLYSPRLIMGWELEKYRNKIHIAHEHFLDFGKFKIKKEFCERGEFVGYIGRFSKEKGTMNFVKAISKILEERDTVRFLIGGNGQLQDEIETHLEENNLKDKVKLVGWIPHEKLVEYLNNLKLIVLPSYTEGLPNILLEAMACGTPVLATSVGAIPDIIKDEETGFIMKNNSPNCVAENTIRALNHRKVDEIARNAKKMVETNFTYKVTVGIYRDILEDLKRG